MRKLMIGLTLAALMLTVTAVPAFAAVHAVSQAGCGNSSNAGATRAADQAPGGPIPVTARAGNDAGHAGSGGDFDGACDVP